MVGSKLVNSLTDCRHFQRELSGERKAERMHRTGDNLELEIRKGSRSRGGKLAKGERAELTKAV